MIFSYLRDFFARVAAAMPWNAWRRYNSAGETASMGSETFMEWLRGHGKRRGIWSEITYFTCMKTLAETLGKIPWKIFKQTPTGITEAKRKDVQRVLKYRPNPYMTPTTFWSTIEMNRNHWGNGYAYIERRFKRLKYGGKYEIKNLWIMPSNCVKVLVDDAGIFAGAGKIYYWYTDPYTGKQYTLPSEDVIHVKTSHTLNGITGMPVQDILRETIGGAGSSQAYLNKLYEQGLTAKAVLEYTGTLSPEAKTALREAFEDFGAGPKNTGRIMPVPLGMKLTPLDIKLTDAQYFELRKYTALQIAGSMGVKPNQINDYEKSSYANSEMQQLSFLTETMLFIMKGYEEEATYKLLGIEAMEAGEYTKLNEKVLLRTDSKTQMEILTGYVDHGVYLVDEARGKLDMSHVEGGDKPIVNGAMIRLEDVGKEGEDPEGKEPVEDPPVPPPSGQEGQEGGDQKGGEGESE